MGARRGFTLIEMMIVVAIISVLAAVAIPLFKESQLQAKLSEAYLNRDGIFTQSTLYVEQDDSQAAWLTPSDQPAGSLGKKLRTWDFNDPDWRKLGWAPDGQVRCTYRYALNPTDTNENLNVYCDIDGDGDVLTIYGQRNTVNIDWAAYLCASGFVMASGSLDLPKGPPDCL
jgi:prepilin-type N-terminal cleavage/methylation domain-containing protein